MNKTAYAEKMLHLERLMREVDELQEELKVATIEYGEPQTVGNIKAAYRAGAAIRDYETPGKEAPPSTIDQFTTTKVSTSWAKVCKAAGLEPILKGHREPTVSFVLVG